jgi:O-antigen/teichoic acid export membrane protein
MNEIGKTRESLLTGALRTLLTSFRQPLAGHAAVLALSQYFAAGMGLLTVIVATRILGPEEYGVAALAIAYPTLLWAFVSFKPISVLTRYLSSFREEGRREEVLSVCKAGFGLDFLTAAAVVAVILASARPVAQRIYHVTEVETLILLYAAAMPFYALLGTSAAVLTSFRRFRVLALLHVAESTLTFGLVMGLLLAEPSAKGLVLGTAAGQAIAGVLMFVAAQLALVSEGQGSWWRARLGKIASLRGEMTKSLAWNYLLVSAAGALQQVPILLLGRIRGPEEAGHYRLAMLLMTTGNYLETALANVAYPTLSAQWGRAAWGRVREQLRAWTLREGLLAGLLLLVSVPLLRWLVPAVFGREFEPMVSGAQMLIAAGAVSACYFWLNPCFYASGRIAFWAKAYTVQVVAVMVAAWVLAGVSGFPGVAAAVAAGRVAFVLLLAEIARRALARECAPTTPQAVTDGSRP